MKPDFSPHMLAFFIRARLFLQTEHREEKWACADMIRDADVTPQDFRLAREGRLKQALPRLRLWGSFGQIPAEHGVILTDDGGQCFASRDVSVPPASQRLVAGGPLSPLPAGGVVLADGGVRR